MDPDGLEAVSKLGHSPFEEFVLQPVIKPHWSAELSSISLSLPSLDSSVFILCTDGLSPVVGMYNIEERSLPVPAGIAHEHPRCLSTLTASNHAGA